MTGEVVGVEHERSGFNPLPKRRGIEQAFRWFGGRHRLMRDHEHLPEMSGAMVRAAMIRRVT